MKYYLEITLLPDTEISLGFIWQKVYQQIHIALADNKIADNQSAIAISFPEYGNKKLPLGDKVRLFANKQEELQQLNIENWLSRLVDYTHLKPIREVPHASKHACFKRKAVKSEQRKAEGLAKHLNKPVREILKYRKEQGLLIQECKLPYIHMESQEQTETGLKNKFRLFIEQEICDLAIDGVYDCYGLSKVATVPWF